MGKNLIMMGIVLIILGIIITLGAKLGIGKLPGDILIKRGNMTFYFPVATSILLSIILTLLINFLRK
ncbi:Protein of unknown function [Peptoclostridium litorale DSM 5388]|uniref:DUF2905 domain-containing protein n=1 Tax=Peptoclostridium litorale DSM 5388 TaxID=1121324 RepID=A0A069RIX5_PEPLI|nr:hypothetical protein CLIT_5c00920 [Peptoclostridium litorale DSM 5388]SIO05136.1 Protein of unknown function [Peptoclostridium litorale DSM 5388]